MRLCLLAAAIVITALACPVVAGAAAQAPVQPARNAYEPPDLAPSSTTPVVFVDALKQSTPWLSAGPLALDGDGQAKRRIHA